MAVPRTIFEIIDNSATTRISNRVENSNPLCLSAFPAPKGPEEIKEITSYDQFIETYGSEIDFDRYGQPLLQAARYVNAGGRLLAKRIVASDSTLANITIKATIKKGSKKVNESGIILYIDKYTGKETVDDSAHELGWIKGSDGLDASGSTVGPLYVVPAGLDIINVPDLYEAVVDGISSTVNTYTNDDIEYNIYKKTTLESKKDEDSNEVKVTIKGNQYTVYSTDKIYKTTVANVTTSEGEIVTLERALVDNKEANDTKGITISYTAETVEDAKSYNDVIKNISSNPITAVDEINDEDATFTLFTFTEMGRGITNKKVRIIPDYSGSKFMNWFRYRLEIIEDSTVTESFSFALDPTFVDTLGNARSLEIASNDSTQLKIKVHDNDCLDFIELVKDAVKDSVNVTSDTVFDMLFAKTKKEAYVDNVFIDEGTQDHPVIDISTSVGIALLGGSDGKFGADVCEIPVVDTAEFENELLTFFTGGKDKEFKDIYDLDKYKIDCLFDANFPYSVKKAIKDLADFREDFMYFRDMRINTNNTNASAIVQDYSDIDRFPRSRNVSTYHTYYDIKNPYNKKQITVTCTYNLALLYVSHYNGGINRPFAGLRYNITIPEAIEGTVNFVPTKLPGIDEKELLDDARINYASYYNNTLVIETLYTSQQEDLYTQLTYSNNVMMIHRIIKAVRNTCPSIRYSFMDGDDFNQYQTEVNKVLEQYSDQFKSISLKYMADDDYIHNKIYYATISVQFKDFVQSEYFKLYALS